MILDTEREYYADKKAVRDSIFESIVITAGFSIFIFFMINMKGSRRGIDISLIMFLCICVVLAFFAILFSRTTLMNYKMIINQQHINSIGIFKIPNEVIEWQKVDIIMIGEVENKNSRLKNFFYGIEFRYTEESGGKNSKSYKLSHIINHDKLMEDIIRVCQNKGIDYKDMR